jgi:RimK family alpha-L-glutamate ligase
MKIAVFAPANSWHFLDLQRAAGTRHQLIACDFRTLNASVESHGQQQFLAGELNLSDVDAVILRIMPSGTLQQIVLRMDVLGALARAGKRIVNHPKTIETAVDKYLTLTRLAEKKIPVPKTFACENHQSALKAFEQLGGDVVVKPLFGSMGQGIERINDEAAANARFMDLHASGEVCYVQKFVEHGDSDIRMLVIGDRVVAMKRTRAGHWLTNIASGAIGSNYQPTTCDVNLARKAVSAVGAEIAGVDLIHDSANGKPLVLEVNAAPGWQATSETLGLDIAKMILDQVEADPTAGTFDRC